jgi:hypothetical protein
MTGTRFATAAACVAAVIAAAGCGGGGEENDYAQQYTGVTKKIERELATLQTEPTADPAKLASQLGTMAGALREAAAEFAAIEAPDNATAAHAKVQAGVDALAADVRRSAEAVEDASSPTATLDALTTILESKGSAQIAAGEQELRQAGYEVQ